MPVSDGYFVQTNTNRIDLMKSSELRRLNMMVNGLRDLDNGANPNSTYMKLKSRLYTMGIDVPVFDWNVIDFANESFGEIEFDATLFAGTAEEQDGTIVDSDLFERKTGDRLVLVVSWIMNPDSGVNLNFNFTTEATLAAQNLEMEDDEAISESEDEDEDDVEDKKDFSKEKSDEKEDDDKDSIDEKTQRKMKKVELAMNEKYKNKEMKEDVIELTFENELTEESKNQLEKIGVDFEVNENQTIVSIVNENTVKDFNDKKASQKKNSQLAIDVLKKTIDKRLLPYMSMNLTDNLGYDANISFIAAGKDSQGVQRKNSTIIFLSISGDDVAFSVIDKFKLKEIGIKPPVVRKQKTYEMLSKKLAAWFNKNADKLLDTTK